MIANRSLGFTLDRMNRVLDQALSNEWTAQQLWVPAIDVVEKKDAYMLHVELPGVGPMPCGDTSILLERTLVTWSDLRWMRDAWRGPVVVKGIHTGDDARRAAD